MESEKSEKSENQKPLCSTTLQSIGMRERKARKVVNNGNAEQGAGMSGMIANLKNIMLNDTPKCRNAEARECGSEKWKARKARKVKIKNRCAQRHSKVSESVVKNGFGVVPSVADGDDSECLSQNERNVLHTMCPECLLN